MFGNLSPKTTSNEPNETSTIENENSDLNQDDGASHVPAASGAATLLPRPVASLVSLVTQSTSLSLRLGSFFGGVALDGARSTTLTGLELSRAVIDGILTRAGRDVASRSGGERGKAEAESLLERSVSYGDWAVHLGGFWANLDCSWLLYIRRSLQHHFSPQLRSVSRRRRSHPLRICLRLCYPPSMPSLARQSLHGQ